ncbi:DUF6531 domain-containing protein [Aquabacterium sp. A7-Y]|uniref:RHS repeat-associated core domain-containing protein n=1 Tax=Aquabacterium sp. A7-Y TaxID=1349605 RepID=UPI00223E5141|nr:RHS repeat-associated core domain-containing protein [Aquabacterium sp. A7-Y]MCW7538647.1 DUF6531 domain-containing protein [Aquabacterium sp. A7-Y]
MMPSAKHGDPQLGIDIHLCLVPPSPSPVPLPTPHFSVIFDPFDYVPIIGATVSVMGMKRATAGTGAIVVHIPPGFPFAPAVPLPDREDELFMGSSTVVADGDPLSYLALPVLGCQVFGIPSPPRPKKKRISPPNLLPTTFNLAIPANVKVGGAPTISMMGMAAKGAFAGLGKLRKSKFAKNLGDRFKQFRQKTFKNMDPGFLKCKVLRAEPVNILTGEVVVEQVDFTLQGRIPIEWVRSYSSNRRRQGACGYGWESPADSRLEIDREDGSVMFLHSGEGMGLFPHLPAAQGDTAAVLELMNGALLSDHGDEFRVRTKSDRIYHFPKALLTAPDERSLECPVGKVSDLCGNWLEYQRIEGQLRAIRESSGRKLMVDHCDGLICRLWFSAPDVGVTHTFVEYEHDPGGDLVAVRDALGNPYCFAYDRRHMVRHTNRANLSFYYEYDTTRESWQVVHAWGDGGLYDYRFAYWPSIRETRITDSLGHMSTVQCDEQGLPILEIDPLGGRTIFEYDAAGRTAAIVDAANLRTEYGYDERGNLLRLTRPDGSTIAIEVDANNKRTTITDFNGAHWQQAWDERGLLVRHTSPLGATTTYEYNDAGLPVSVTDARQATTKFTFDRMGCLVALVDALGNITRLQWDELGNVMARTDPLERTVRYRYDRKSRLLEEELPDGKCIRYTYDAQDALTHCEDENGAQSHFEYCGQGLLRKHHRPDGTVVEYHYDTEEQLIGVSNQRGETYRLRRDALGQVVEETDYWGQTTTYSFDAVGHLRQRCDPLGRVIAFTTDKLGRIRRKAFMSPQQAGNVFEETFDFDPNGNLIGCTNPHVTVQRRFDAEGKLLEERQGTFIVRNSFDEVGNRIKRETSTGNTVLYGYDLLGLAATIQINDDLPITIERDPAGQVRKETLGAALQRHFKYDELGRPTVQGVRRDAEWLFHTQYEYDPAGNLTQRHDSHYGVDRYRYDPLGRIVAHIDTQDKLTRFYHDPAGDRMLTHAVEQRAQQLVREGERSGEWRRDGYHDGVRYRFDRAGNLVERIAEGRLGTPDEEGNTITLAWDANQRLVHSEKNGVETSYSYDPLGRRVFKQTGNTRICFGWDGETQVAEVAVSLPGPTAPETSTTRDVDLVSKPVESSAWGQAREYLYYPDSFVPLARLERHAENGTSDGRIFHYHNDPNGCPTRITDAEGAVVWAANFSVWGGLKTLHRQQLENQLRFQGQYHDVETGLHYNRHRYYDAHIGSYVSVDPLLLDAGDNLYEYTGNPLVWVDPLGLSQTYHLARALTGAGRPLVAGQTAHHIVQQNNPSANLTRQLLVRNGLTVDDAANGARLWGTASSQVAQVAHPGRAAARARGTYHAGRHIHSAANDELIYRILRSAERRGGARAVEAVLNDIGRRQESGSWMRSFNACGRR